MGTRGHLRRCSYCLRGATTRDHVVPRCLLEKPYPPNLLTIPSCRECNTGFKQDEEYGCVATFQKRQESDWSSRPGSVSYRHPEQVVDELNLSPHIRTAHPPRLPLPDHVHGLVALDRSPRRLKLTKSLLGFHASFDRSMILLHDVVQVLDRPVAATASQESFLFHPCNRRAVKAGLVRVDDTGCGCDGLVSALRNRRLAVAASRKPESTKLIVAPVESMAR